MLRHQGLHTAPSSPARQAPTASTWATGREKTACSVPRAPSVNGAPPNLQPALRKPPLTLQRGGYRDSLKNNDISIVVSVMTDCVGSVDNCTCRSSGPHFAVRKEVGGWRTASPAPPAIFVPSLPPSTPGCAALAATP